MDALQQGADVLFLLVGAILVFAMHAGFAFLEVGTVRHKNQVNALVKILADFAVSTMAYFFVGYCVAYGVSFFVTAATLSGAEGTGAVFAPKGYGLVKFFFLLTFAAAVPAIISGGVAERMKFWPQIIASALVVALVYPFFEGLAWNSNYGLQAQLTENFGAPFHDFAGSVVVHAVGGWLGLAAVLVLGQRLGRYKADGKPAGIPPSSIPFLALGSWLLCIGWFGFNVMSSQTIGAVNGLVAMNSLMAMVGGILSALVIGRNDPGFVHNGALAGLVAICAGSDLVHPLGGLAIGAIAGGLFVFAFNACHNRWRIDDVLGVWALHGLCGAWGGIAAGIFGMTALGGMGGVSFLSQLVGTVAGLSFAFTAGLLIYGLLKKTMGVRLTEDQEYKGADRAIHSVSANPEGDIMA